MIKIDISKNLGSIELNVKFGIEQGEFIALSGASGSGKTTLLRVLAGLEEAKGTIEVYGKNWQNLPPQKREIGMVFQDYALFSNMNVEQNLLFVNKDIELANRLLELTELKNIKKQYPSQLSGGQKQRVALCRALMKRPKILLLDEPLSALDWKMRNTLQAEISKVHKDFNLTTIMVTHDRAEIFKLANRVVELSEGNIVKDVPISKELKAQDSLKLLAEVIKIEGNKTIVLANGQLITIESKNLSVGELVELTASKIYPSQTIINVN